MGDATSSPILASATAEQLNNAETRRLLDTIDSLRDLHIGGIVDLPQIIVVGDQCSGKSSVLEAISRVHFPVSDGICTRFPTELVLRRAPQESTDLRIRYASDTLANNKNSSPTRTPFHESNFHRSELPAIINRAKEHMGLADGKTTGFSKHVLRVEIAGPDIPSLTLVDLPGIFHSGVSSQPQEWKPVVDDMVESYMKQKNSIILMVVSADISLSKHAILDITIKHDVSRERTIGVITKVDLCPGSNLEDEYLRLARGQEPSHQLRLGWHILRNRGPKESEVDFDQRDIEEEKFLKTGAWSTLPLSSRGVDSLRRSLGATLLKQIRSSLPEVIRDIDTNLQNRQKRLAKLGSTRSNTDEMRDYLLRISTAFHRLAEHAVEGRYNDPFFATTTVEETGKIKFRKLRALLRNLNRAFDITMRTKGARYKVEWEQEHSDSDTGLDGEVDTPDYLQPFLKLYDFPAPAPKSESVINDTIERLASASQGVEFPGLPNSDLIMQLFRDQSEPWRRIAECHMDIVIERTRLFVYHLFDYVLEDDKRTRDAILAECVDPSFESITEILQSKLGEILRPYTSGHGLPLELEFRTGLSKRKIGRMATQIVNLLDKRDSVAYNTSEYQILKHEDVKNIILEANSGAVSDFGTDTVIDMMLTHYEMSLRTFTDNVVHLVLESCLISKLPNIFSTRVVAQMSDEILKRLAEESDEVKLERSQLIEEIEKLKRGLQNCQRSRPRDFSELPDNFIELAPRTEPPKKSRIRVKLPSVHDTTAVKQKPDASIAKEQGHIVVQSGEETSPKPNEGRSQAKSDPVIALSSPGNNGQSTTAESSKQQAPSTSLSVAGQSSVAHAIRGSTLAELAAKRASASSLASGSAPATQAPVTAATIFAVTKTTSTPTTSQGLSNTTATSTTSTATVPNVSSDKAPAVTTSAFGSVSALQAATTKPPSGSPATSPSATAELPSFGSKVSTGATTPAFGPVSVLQAANTPVPGPATTAAASITPSGFGSNKTPAVAATAFDSSSSSKPATGGAFLGWGALSSSSSNEPKPVTSGGSGSFGGFGGFGSSISNPPGRGLFGTPYSTYDPPGTTIAIFQPFLEKEYNSSVNLHNSFQNILFQNPYKGWSVDELRLVDYKGGHRPPAKSTNMFGIAVASQPQASGGSGALTSEPPKVGSFGTGLFGQQPLPQNPPKQQTSFGNFGGN